MSDEMEEIINDFITEAEESLDKIDPLFVEIETRGYDKDLLNDIFRSVHTLKGAAGFLGFQPVVDVAHNAESILKKIREGEIGFSRPLMDVILRSVDMLRLLIRHIKDKDNAVEDTASLVKDLEEALAVAVAGGGPPPEAAAPAPAGGVPEAPEAADKGGNGSSKPVPGPQEPEVREAPPAAPAEAAERLAPERRESLQTLRVDIDRIDKVMDLTGEVVLVRNRLLNISNYLETKYAEDPHVESLLGTVAFLNLVTSDMQLAVMRMRMQPIKKVFGKFPRLVRDIAGTLGKDVELQISGEDTEVDKSVIEQIGDPMVHIIRNAIDHGLDSPEERRKRGKPEKGRISISAYQKGNQIVIEVSDDGRGINVDRVRKKALERGIITAEECQRMSDDAAVNLIFLPGFSTAEVATELSGRGVGMDVVKTNISKLNGYVEVMTAPGTGSTFRISIPLTLAIIHALMVKSGGRHYAIPLSPIEEILKVRTEDIGDVVGQKVLVIRGRVHPLFELADVLGSPSFGGRENRYVIVISIGENRFCLAIDELLGQEEIVIKTMEGIDAGSSHVIGATITGDGGVVLILDLGSVSRSISGHVKNL